MTDNYQAKPVAGEAVAGAIDARGQEASPGFTTKYPLLNDLLQETFWLGKGPNNHDTGMAWFESLELYLASREQSPASPDAGAGAVAEGCALGCAELCMAKEHGCASECPALPWQPAAPASAPEAPEQQGEREAFVTWLSTTYPTAYSVEDAEHFWRYNHVSVLAWQARAALAQAAPATGKVGAVVTEEQINALLDRPADLRHLIAEGTRERMHLFARDVLALATPAATVQAETERDAWRAYAEHQEWCQTCAESVNNCPEGRDLKLAALTAVQADKGGV